MFQEKNILFLYVETPLHAGTGRGLGAIDLPIQRERATGYPIIQASSIKGSLRAAADGKTTSQNAFLEIFGPDTVAAHEYAGALSCGDANILLFPVRSLAGVFAWVTSLEALARFERVAALTGKATGFTLPANTVIPDNECWIADGTPLIAGRDVVLEEFSFTAVVNPLVQTIANQLVNYAFPSGAEYGFWKHHLPKKLCFLPENAFRDFVLYSTEVQTHVKLVASTKTVDKTIGGLWTSESLPADSLLYTPLLATKSRSPNPTLDAPGVMNAVRGLQLGRLQLGGDETTGQGIVALKFYS